MPTTYATETATSLGSSVAVEPAITNIALPDDMAPVIPNEEAIFWTETWLAGDQETRNEYERGGGRDFATAKDLIRYLISDED